MPRRLPSRASASSLVEPAPFREGSCSGAGIPSARGREPARLADACALFDTDTPGNTFIDFVVCVRVENFNSNSTDVRIVADGGVFAFHCSETVLNPILVDPASGPNVIVTETNIDAAWQLTSAGCATPGTPPVGTGTFDATNNRVTGVSIQSGTVTTCTFTDALRSGTLRVIKIVVNDNGGTATAGQFTYTLGDGSSVTAAAGAESPGTSYTRNVGTTYNVQENSGGPSGYTVSYSADCSGTIAASTTKTCTINNNDNAPTLRLRKTVTNDNGGTALTTAWTLTATGTGGSPTNLSGTTPVNSGATFKADTYTLAETGEPASGYTAGSWSCVVTGSDPVTPVTVTNSQVTVGLGADVTCTINNNDTKASPNARRSRHGSSRTRSRSPGSVPEPTTRHQRT